MTPSLPPRRRALALALPATLAAASVVAIASANIAAATPATVTGTATGSQRTGLTAANLVKLTSLGNADVWLGLASAKGSGANYDVQTELLDNGTPVASGLVR